MLVGLAAGLGAAKTYAAREHYLIDANRELMGLGAANVAAAWRAGWSRRPRARRAGRPADAHVPYT
jgi:MFS superfamily sulfate permease-like transporter